MKNEDFRCVSCRYFKQTEALGRKRGECHFRPPTADFAWPTVGGEDFCSEWAPTLEKEQEIKQDMKKDLEQFVNKVKLQLMEKEGDEQ